MGFGAGGRESWKARREDRKAEEYRWNPGRMFLEKLGEQAVGSLFGAGNKALDRYVFGGQERENAERAEMDRILRMQENELVSDAELRRQELANQREADYQREASNRMGMDLKDRAGKDELDYRRMLAEETRWGVQNARPGTEGNASEGSYRKLPPVIRGGGGRPGVDLNMLKTQYLAAEERVKNAQAAATDASSALKANPNNKALQAFVQESERRLIGETRNRNRLADVYASHAGGTVFLTPPGDPLEGRTDVGGFNPAASNAESPGRWAGEMGPVIEGIFSGNQPDPADLERFGNAIDRRDAARLGAVAGNYPDKNKGGSGGASISEDMAKDLSAIVKASPINGDEETKARTKAKLMTWITKARIGKATEDELSALLKLHAENKHLIPSRTVTIEKSPFGRKETESTRY